MATTRTTISISEKAYKLLLQFKQPNQTFSEVIEFFFERGKPPADTCGDLLDRLESLPPPEINDRMVEEFRNARGRRSSLKS